LYVDRLILLDFYDRQEILLQTLLLYPSHGRMKAQAPEVQLQKAKQNLMQNRDH
jgi:hypothetical protein